MNNYEMDQSDVHTTNALVRSTLNHGGTLQIDYTLTFQRGNNITGASTF